MRGRKWSVADIPDLSGRTAVYRRSVLMEIQEEFMNETFWGVPCLSGDDKRLTTLTLERGYLTYMQRTAQVWSTCERRASVSRTGPWAGRASRAFDSRGS